MRSVTHPHKCYTSRDRPNQGSSKHTQSSVYSMALIAWQHNSTDCLATHLVMFLLSLPNNVYLTASQSAVRYSILYFTLSNASTQTHATTPTPSFTQYVSVEQYILSPGYLFNEADMKKVGNWGLKFKYMC